MSLGYPFITPVPGPDGVWIGCSGDEAVLQAGMRRRGPLVLTSGTPRAGWGMGMGARCSPWITRKRLEPRQEGGTGSQVWGSQGMGAVSRDLPE